MYAPPVSVTPGELAELAGVARNGQQWANSCLRFSEGYYSHIWHGSLGVCGTMRTTCAILQSCGYLYKLHYSNRLAAKPSRIESQAYLPHGVAGLNEASVGCWASL